MGTMCKKIIWIHESPQLILLLSLVATIISLQCEKLHVGIYETMWCVALYHTRTGHSILVLPQKQQINFIYKLVKNSFFLSHENFNK